MTSILPASACIAKHRQRTGMVSTAVLRARFGAPPRAGFPLVAALGPRHRCACAQIRPARSQSSLAGSSAVALPRLRFAPSPTGNLHLGGLRTALLNYLFARKAGGNWILRIEDTDQNRFVEGSADALQAALSWAGLRWDEGPGASEGAGESGPYVQSERLEIYRKHAQDLVQAGQAYYDFRPPEERLPLERRPVQGTVHAGSHRSAYSPPSGDDAEKMIREGKRYSIRLRFPPQAIEHQDLVFGKMTFPADVSAEDPVLLKADGWPTYHLSSVVDDHLMGITHVFRGEEWLPSVPKHLLLYRAFGWKPPLFAHLPLLMNEDGSKLSKRSGHASVEDYRSAGYEPEALVNFIALMGYNHHGTAAIEAGSDEAGQEESEVMTLSHLVDSFDLARVSHSRAALNLKKLRFLNNRHLHQKARADGSVEQSELFDRLGSGLQECYRLTKEELPYSRIRDIVLLIADRADTLREIIEQAKVLFVAPDWTAAPAQKLKAGIHPENYRIALATARSRFEAVSSEAFGESANVASVLEELAKEVTAALPADVAKKSKGKGALMKPLRHALTGERSGPTVPDVLAVLGKDAALQRLADALKQHESA